jgi:NTP pyrophosphatase (non-canonical NTP hydrolase)
LFDYDIRGAACCAPFFFDSVHHDYRSKAETYTMEMKELEELMHEFVTGKGWYDDDSPKEQAPRNLAISLAVEAAEVLEHFQWSGEISDRHALEGELADVALYLLQLASVSGVNLEQAILDKLAQNRGRTWPEP